MVGTTGTSETLGVSFAVPSRTTPAAVILVTSTEKTANCLHWVNCGIKQALQACHTALGHALQMVIKLYVSSIRRVVFRLSRYPFTLLLLSGMSV